jgi:hypothetical protein
MPREAGAIRKTSAFHAKRRFRPLPLHAKAEARALLGFISKELARLAQARSSGPEGAAGTAACRYS